MPPLWRKPDRAGQETPKDLRIAQAFWLSPHGLTVRTPAPQAGSAGSIPAEGTVAEAADGLLHRIVAPVFAGSIPAGHPAETGRTGSAQAFVAQRKEHQPAKLGVAGSSPAECARGRQELTTAPDASSPCNLAFTFPQHTGCEGCFVAGPQHQKGGAESCPKWLFTTPVVANCCTPSI